MTYVRDPDLDKMLEDAARDFDERISRLTPEQVARIDARIERETAEAAAEAEAAHAAKESGR